MQSVAANSIQGISILLPAQRSDLILPPEGPFHVLYDGINPGGALEDGMKGLLPSSTGTLDTSQMRFLPLILRSRMDDRLESQVLERHTCDSP